MHDKIVSALRSIERERNVRILFAAESGSRAWGFASPDSDYDVRAIYVPQEDWYWTIAASPKDTFEAMLPGDLDVSAWELRKTLRLFHDGNPSLMEWFGSPIVYFADEAFRFDMLRLLPTYFNPLKARHHYRSLAGKAMSHCVDGRIPIKKLFYALRGLLAAAWCVEKGTMPPTEFERLLSLETIPASILSEVRELTARKACADEKTVIDLSSSLGGFYESERERIQRAPSPSFHASPIAPLNDVLRNYAAKAFCRNGE